MTAVPAAVDKAAPGDAAADLTADRDDAGVVAEPHPIEAHRLLGDGRSTALVRADAVVDWWCAPRADSPPLLWSLLDEAAGASAAFPDYFAAGGSPLPAGPTATTLLRCSDGRRVEVVDGLVTDDRCARLVRIVRALDAPLDLVHELRLGGFDSSSVSWGEDGRGSADGTDVHVLGGVSRADGGLLRTRLTGPRNRRIVLVVAWGEPGAPDSELDADALLRRLEEQTGERDRAIAVSRIPSMLPDRAKDALSVLYAMADRDTGAPLAAVTTSLPEAVGHDRQYDYRYTWIRDAGLALSAADLLGSRDLAGRYLATIASLTGGEVPRVPVTRPDGSDVPDEREIPGVAGWGQSLPIRVGNDAKGQLQYDVLGVLAESVSVHAQQGGKVDGTWPMISAIAEKLSAEVLSGDRPPSAGIWELREPLDLVSADIGRWVALDRAIHLAGILRPWRLRPDWVRARRIVRSRVLEALLPSGCLPQTYDPGDASPDASGLLAIVFGLLERDDPRASRLLDATLDALGTGPFVYRYRPGGDDGFSGREGAFLPVSWWAVSALALVGRVDEAVDRAQQLHHHLPRLLPEEWDPLRQRGLGNVPLLWSHAECARALYLIDAARIRSRFGVVGEQTWRVGRGVLVRARHAGG